MITFAQIQDRIGCVRPDKLPREWQLAFQVAARRLASETFALQAVVEFTITANSLYIPVYATADEKESIFIFKAEWQKADLSWVPMDPCNQAELAAFTAHTYDTPGEMRQFTVDPQGNFKPDRPPAIDTQVRAVVAYKPLSDFDEVDFGHNYEDALVEGALSYLYRLPGAEKDSAASEMSETRFQALASGLRGAVLVGDAGYARGSSAPERIRSTCDRLRF
jgi:hypothetical protein